MAYSFENADHLPHTRSDGRAPDPNGLPRQRRGITPQMHGRYPDYNVLEQADKWDTVTREVVLARVDKPPALSFFGPAEAATLAAFCDVVLAQDREPRIPVMNFIDARLSGADTAGLDGYQYAEMPDDRETWRRVARGLDQEAQSRGFESFVATSEDVRATICEVFSRGALRGGVWDGMSGERAWNVVMRSILWAFYSHPWAWNEIGFGGPAYPRGYMRLGAGQKESWQGDEADDVDPVYLEAQSPGASSESQPAAPEKLDQLRAEAQAASEVAETTCSSLSVAEKVRSLRYALKGAVGPKDNDSRFLLDVHHRALPGLATMRRFQDEDTVDMVIIGAGAGGGVLAQRLSRAGWRVVVLECGPFWDPDKDWVSDEAGAQPLYWNQKRIIGGTDPIELGKNNSGRGVGGSMIHYAGYTPRFHPSDFETYSRDGVGADWPISYEDVRPHYELVEAELPVSGQDWPWGYPHKYPFAAHPVSGAASRAIDGARRFGLEMRVGPVGITNGTFGNRPHCIYRGFCLQGCKVNAKASPLVTHIPDAIEHGAEIRANCMVTRIELGPNGRCSGVRYMRGGEEHFQRASAITVSCYSIETPRLLLNSTSAEFPDGIGNHQDQLGRYVMVQGAPQIAGRFPERMHMYKAPPPEASSEQFYETDGRRGFKRGFSVQSVGPLPIGWAEHVLADGHWGHALREYMRDYNHWSILGALCELLPQPDNRVTLADERDRYGMPIARFDYSLCENDRANIAYAGKIMKAVWQYAGAQDILSIDRYAHLIGGCRMGTAPENSMVDCHHRVWGVPNLFVSDGSVCPTQGSANPALTIMALSSRFAEGLVKRRITASTGAVGE
jgi:choline dehydrogenase-like flavoprotein